MSLKLRIYLSIYLLFISLSHKTLGLVVIIDPAGDSKITGRVFPDQYERNITMHCAECIKKILEEESSISKNPLQIFITHTTGQIKKELEFQQFSNILEADFFIHISAVPKIACPPAIFLYRLNFSDQLAIQQKSSQLFIPFDEVHIQSSRASEQFGKNMYNYLNQEEFRRLYTIHNLLAVPCKPLIGVQAPGIMIELAVDSCATIDNLIPTLSLAIHQAIAAQA